MDSLRKLLLILGLILTSGIVKSQAQEIELLVRPALTSLRGNDFLKKNYDPTMNFSACFGVNYSLGTNSRLNLSLLYEKKGAHGEILITLRNENNESLGEELLTIESNYTFITIPIQWGQEFGQKIKYRFGVGVYTGFLLKQEQKAEGPTGSSSDNETDNFKKMDFGLSASFNVFLPINEKVSIKAGLDNNYGLINVSDVPTAGHGIKHNSLGLAVGLNLKLQ